MTNLLRLLVLFKPYTAWLVGGILLSLVTLLSNVALMSISGWFISSMALAGAAGVSMNYFSPAAMIRAAAIFRTGSRYAERLVTHEATFRLLSSLRVWFYRHLEPLVPAALEDMRSGDLLSRIRADIDTLDNLYIRVLAPVIVASISIGLLTLVMSRYDSGLARVLLLFLLLAGVVLPWFMAVAGKHPGQQIVEQSALLRTHVIDGVQGMAELTICGALDQSADDIGAASERLIRAQTRSGRVAGVAQSGLLLISNLALLVIVWLAIPLVHNGSIAEPELAMLALFTLAAFEAVMPLPEAFRLLGQIQTAAGRLFEIIDRAPAVRAPARDDSGVITTAPEHFDIAFQQLDFSYRADVKPVLNNFSLDIAAAEKVALVGTTGAGKSTLIQLLLHYRAPQSGTITLGGRALDEYSSEQLHEWIAVVPQKVHLFNTTIRQNLLLAKPGASQADLDRACALAQLSEFIAQQPEGYDTWVGETGVRLSGGQARRIAVARALLRDFKCLILDEPGESLDSKTSLQMLTGLMPALENKSLLLITHSHTGLALMDKIVVLEQGTCVEQGNYQSLMQQRGYLAQGAVLFS